MGILTTLAQSTDYYNSYYYNNYDAANSAAGTGAAVAILMTVYLFLFIFIIAVYVVYALCLMRIFKKAGVPAWAAWVPFYNQWKLLEIGGQQGFWAILAIIPFLNIASAIFMYIAQYHIGKKLGKGGEFVLWAIFIPLVWYIWLAVDASKWNDKASSAPSLHHPIAAK